MPKMLQVRNVPDDLHRELARRARAHGLTLTAYVQQVLEREAQRPALDEELFERIKNLPRVDYDIGVLMQELDDEEERDWDEWFSTRTSSSRA